MAETLKTSSAKVKGVGSRTHRRVHFLYSYKENEPKEIRPAIKLSLKSNESTLVSRNIDGCCETREKGIRSDSHSRRLHQYYFLLGLLDGEGKSKDKFISHKT